MSTRKDFIIASSLGMATSSVARAAAAPLASPAPAAKGDVIAPFVFDRAAFTSAVTRDVRHRHLFATVTLDDGLVLEAMRNVLNAYENALGERPASVTSAGVLYHNSGALLGFNDGAWNDLIIPAAPKLPELSQALGAIKAGDGNRWLHGDAHDPDDASIETLGARGAIFFVCNNATRGYAQMLAGALGLHANDVYARLAAGLVPGAMLVPAGVWAIHALQEAHFTYEQVAL